MADQDKPKYEETSKDDETAVLTLIQETYESSHDWDVVFERIQLEYYVPYISNPSDLACVIEYCAARGYLRVLKWLRSPEFFSGGPDNPCPWNERACAYAAASGHLHVLKWLRGPEFSSGVPGGPCPWDELACFFAAQNNNVKILEYLYDSEAPYSLPSCIHKNCIEFFETYGESWKSRRFDVPLGWMKPAKASQSQPSMTDVRPAKA